MNNPFAKKIAAVDFEGNARQLSDNVLQSAEEAVETTRDFAHDALGRADRKARDLRRSLDPAIDELAHRAQDYARRGRGLAIDAGAKARQAVSQYADVTTRYVADQPVKAVLIAAAAGAIIAALLVSRRNPPQR